MFFFVIFLIFLLHLYSSRIYSNILLFIAIFYYILSFTGDIVQITATQTICLLLFTPQWYLDK
ncbi:hypothetical protein DWY47_16650 [Ruminococcus sp. AF25-23LB]|nr:hypothetical protein DWY47_16650 [Ruminococcus sp. AF25-23LB]